jgi:hypothetical protein
MGAVATGARADQLLDEGDMRPGTASSMPIGPAEGQKVALNATSSPQLAWSPHFTGPCYESGP